MQTPPSAIISALSWNPNLPIKFVLSHPTWPWDMEGFSSNPGVTAEVVAKHDLKWDPVGLSRNPNIQSLIEASPKYNWSMRNVSINSAINTTFVAKFPDLKWDYDMLVLNPNYESQSALGMCNIVNLSMSPTLTLGMLGQTKGWCMALLSNNPYLPAGTVEKFGDWDWYPKLIATNPAVPISTLQKMSTWDPSDSSAHPGLTLPVMESCAGKWDMELLSANGAVDMKFVADHKWNWNYSTMSQNPNLTAQFVLDNMDKKWDWAAIAAHKCLTPKLVEARSDWSDTILFSNKHLPIDYLLKLLSRH